MALPLAAIALGAFSAAAIKGLIARGLAVLGLGVVSYVGINTAVSYAITQLHSHIGGLPSDIANLLGMAGFDVALSVYVSAHTGLIVFLLAQRALKKLTFVDD